MLDAAQAEAAVAAKYLSRFTASGVRKSVIAFHRRSFPFNPLPVLLIFFIFSHIQSYLPITVCLFVTLSPRHLIDYLVIIVCLIAFDDVIE